MGCAASSTTVALGPSGADMSSPQARRVKEKSVAVAETADSLQPGAAPEEAVPVVRNSGAVRVEKLQDENRRLHCEVVHLRALLESSEARAKEFEQRLDSAEEERQRLLAMGGSPIAARGVRASAYGGCAEELERAIEAHAALASRLEEELRRVQSESAKTKEQYERRIKKLRASSARAKAEFALSVFELKDEKTQLQEELARLRDEVASYKSRQSSAGTRRGSATASRAVQDRAGDGDSGRGSVAGEGDGTGGPDEECDSAGGHLRLIVDLSQQVAALDDQLTTARAEIERLEAQLAVARGHGPAVVA